MSELVTYLPKVGNERQNMKMKTYNDVQDNSVLMELNQEESFTATKRKKVTVTKAKFNIHQSIETIMTLYNIYGVNKKEDVVIFLVNSYNMTQLGEIFESFKKKLSKKDIYLENEKSEMITTINCLKESNPELFIYYKAVLKCDEKCKLENEIKELNEKIRCIRIQLSIINSNKNDITNISNIISIAIKEKINNPSDTFPEIYNNL
jgi:hypothetical protein